MRRNTPIAALTAVIALAGCTLPETEGSNRRNRDEVITTDGTEVDLAEMDFTAAEVVDLMVAQEPAVVEDICTTAADLSDAMLDRLRPRMAPLLRDAAADWGVSETDLYDAVLDECGR